MKLKSDNQLDPNFPRFIWVRQDEFTRSVDLAMLEFLRAIKRIAPEVLSSLACDVFPLYQSLYQSGTAFERAHLLNYFTHEVIYGVTLAGRIPIARMTEEMLKEQSDGISFFNLRAAVYRWAKRFHLDGWILAFATETLKSWNQLGTLGDLDWEFDVDRPILVYPTLEFRFEYPQWQPNTDTWSSYEKKLDKAFSQAKHEYNQKMLGTPKDIESRKAVDKVKSEHFEWLVCFQIKGQSYKEIYEKQKATCNLGSDKAVYKAVKESALLIGLPLRNTRRKPGRPRKH